MTTDDLITGLGAELSPLRPGFLRRAVLRGLAAGTGLAALAFALVWGLRPDLLFALADPAVVAKTALPLALVALALPAALSTARPGARAGGLGALWLVPAALLAIVLAELLAVPPAGWSGAVLDSSILTCLVSVPLLSAPILGGLLAALRHGAPEVPALCGARAGLVAGGGGAAIYSLFCTEDSPLFYGLWYTLAIAAVTGAAAVLGHRRLRW